MKYTHKPKEVEILTFEEFEKELTLNQAYENYDYEFRYLLVVKGLESYSIFSPYSGYVITIFNNQLLCIGDDDKMYTITEEMLNTEYTKV